MTKILSGTYPSLYTLSGAADNPATITTTGLLEAGLYAASLSSAWMITNAGSVLGAGVTLRSAGTVVNAGSIASLGTNGFGVDLLSGGLVSNAATGTITSTFGVGVNISGGVGTVLNAGQISSSGSHTAVALDLGGSVTNQSGGTITGGTAHGAVYITGTAGTVTNYGQLTGGGVAGVHLQAGGTVTNQSGGTITSGTNHVGVYVTGGSGGAVSNAGLISGVDLFSGGGVTNLATGTIDNGNAAAVDVAGATGTLVNAGRIVSGGTHTAVYFKVGGTVTNASGGYVMGGGPGIDITGNAGGVTNAGVVLAGGTHSGVDLLHGGYVNNVLTGTISAIGGDAVYIGGGIGTVINAGTLDGGTVGPSIQFVAGGVISNVASGVIFGADHSGVYSIKVAATVLNAGIITGAGTSGTGGVAFKAGGYVSNAATGIITSVKNTGVYIIGGAGTITNAGTIAGAGGTKAVLLAAGFTDRLVVDPGAMFGGTVNGGNTIGAAAVSTLELAPGASAGTLSGLGTQFINFAQITIDANASWTLTGANTIVAGATLTELSGANLTVTGTLENDGAIVLDPSTMTVAGLIGTGSVTVEAGSMLEVQGTITGGETIAFGGSGAFLRLDSPGSVAGSVTDFGFGERIDLKGVDPTTVRYADGLLTFSDGSFALSLANTGRVITSASGGGTEVSLTCFRVGTRIRTPGGEVPVEQLVVGDQVEVLLGDRAAPIIWIGHRAVDCKQHPKPAQAWPVRISANAFGPGLPCRDLFLSPNHAVYVGDVLIPVKRLINGISITQMPMDEVTYYHIELPQHDVVSAEGLPVESFLDMRDGSNYANRPGPVRLYPDYAARMWEAFGCARLIVTGPELEAARALVARFTTDRAAA